MPKKASSKKTATKTTTSKSETSKPVAPTVSESITKIVKKATSRLKTKTDIPDVQLPEVVDNAARKLRKNNIIKSSFAKERVITQESPHAVELHNSGAYGTELSDGKLQLSLAEALYLMEKKRIAIYDGRNKILNFESFVRRASRVEPKFWTKYAVYKDMRNRGYIVKTALKFGADFRVYDRGIKPGQDHARWIVYPVHEGEKYTWFDFAAKNRVAHSTKKRLMMAVVDDENDVTYWEIKWVRP